MHCIIAFVYIAHAVYIDKVRWRWNKADEQEKKKKKEQPTCDKRKSLNKFKIKTLCKKKLCKSG